MLVPIMLNFFSFFPFFTEDSEKYDRFFEPEQFFRLSLTFTS